jgi:hypothetical protein
MAPALLQLAALAAAFARRSLSTAALSDEALALAMATLAACGLALADFGTRDEALPFGWTLATSPVAWLCAWVLARAGRASAAARMVSSRSAGRAEAGARGLLGTAALVRHAHASIVAWYGLGALAVPATLPVAARFTWLASCALFVCKLALAHALLSHFAAIARPRWVELSCALCAPVIAIALMQLSTPLAASSRALGFLTCGLLAGRLLRTIVAWGRSPASDHDRALVPLA